MTDITTEAQKLYAAIFGGKLRWTTGELAAFALEKYPQPATAEARLAGLVRSFADGLGVDIKKDGPSAFVFGQPAVPGQVVYTDRVIEKVVTKEVPVEKVVCRDAPGAKAVNRLEAPVVFPELPLAGKANSNYVQPVWYKLMESALNAGKHVAIAGPPGGGKSTGPEQYFIRKGQPFVTVNGDAGFRRKDMEGSVEVAEGRTFFRVAEFAAAAVNGWGCILNEVNAADPDALMYINGLLEVPFVVNIHGKAYPVHPDFRLVVTYNPGLVGTKALPQAFKDRFFPIKLDFPPKAFIRKMIIAKTGISEDSPYLERLLKYSADCWALHVKGNLRYQISPRRLFDVVFLLETKACEDINDALKRAIVDAVDSAADAQMLIKLITSPLNEIGAVSQFA